MALITHASMETDLRLAAVLDQEVRALLTDQVQLRKVPGLSIDLGSVNGTGSDTKRVRYAGLDGYDAMTSAGEADVANTSLTDSSTDVAVVRLALRYDQNDLSNFTGTGNMDINPMRLAASMVGAAEQGWNILLSAVIDDWSVDAVDSAADMTADDFYDATYQLELNSVPGPYFSVLHPRQHADLRDSIRGELGAAQYMEATQEQLVLHGQGYQGTWLGVAIYNSSDVESGAGKREGGMWGQGAIGHATGNPTQIVGGSEVIRSGEVVTEIERDASGGLHEIVGNFYTGVAIIEQGRGTGINTDD